MAKRPGVSSATPKKSFGPGRSRLRQAQRDRHHGLFNLWYHYSARLRRDVILKSDVEFAHFCWLEGDPEILRYELEPGPVVVAMGSQSRQTWFDALVEFRDSRPPQLREVKTDEDSLSPREVAQREAQQLAAAGAGFEYVRITKGTLNQRRQLIRNWRCALAFLAACRELILEPYRNELAELVIAQRRLTLEELLRQTDPTLRPVYLAALFSGLQQGMLSSDLDTQPLCDNSRLWAMEEAT